MNAIKFRFSFALAIACVLSMAGFAQTQSSPSNLSANAECPGSADLSSRADGGGGSGGSDFDVKWDSLVPGVFK